MNKKELIILGGALGVTGLVAALAYNYVSRCFREEAEKRQAKAAEINSSVKFIIPEQPLTDLMSQKGQ